MGVFLNVIVAFWAVLVALLLYNVLNYVLVAPEPPKINEDWWGKGDSTKEDKKIYPFKINISDEILEDLQLRLERARFIDKPLDGIAQEYGTSDQLIKIIVNHWKTNYKWRSREKYLNTLPQFTTSIQGLNIHFAHIKPKNVPKGTKVLPLLMIHGWPGSVREFYELAPMLTTPSKERNIVFELVMPHIPGYGFSETAVKPGLGAAETALVFKNLMHRLGHEKFYVQGGDMGGIILNYMSVMYPDNILGFHNNMCVVFSTMSLIKLGVSSYFPSLMVRNEDMDRVYPLSKMMAFLLQEMGYLHIQATKPDSIGAAMDDSPVGLAAYHIEKFVTGLNFDNVHLKDGGITQKLKMDDILDVVMIYWVTRSAATAYRMYSETFNMKLLTRRIIDVPIKVPSACARFKYDFFAPDGIIRDIYQNLVQVRDYDGGHFPAMEQPKLLANDIFDAIEKFEKIYSKESKKSQSKKA